MRHPAASARVAKETKSSSRRQRVAGHFPVAIEVGAIEIGRLALVGAVEDDVFEYENALQAGSGNYFQGLRLIMGGPA